MTLSKLEEGCKRVLGHGESCVAGHLCDSCEKHIKSYMFQTNLMTVVSLLRNNKRLWKRTNNRNSKRLQDALDALCSFIEDEKNEQ